MPHVPDIPLIMYLTVLEGSIRYVLGQHDEIGRKEHVIYYLSKKFSDCESRYSMIEKEIHVYPYNTINLQDGPCHIHL